MDTITYLCEDTADGIFTAIYKAWQEGTSHTHVEVNNGQNLSMFSKYIEVDTDIELALKVVEAINNKLSDEIYYYVFRATLSNKSSKAESIYRFLRKAFRVGKDIMNQLADEDVMEIFALTRYISNEVHRYEGFIRFEELSNGVLVSKINPQNNVVPVVAVHFADRLHTENWIILDTVRNISAIHRAGKGYILSYDVTEDRLNEIAPLSLDEVKFKALWNRFFDTIAIEPRKNYELQRNMMPIRYRKYM